MLRGESVYVVYDSQVEEEDEDGKYMAYLYRAPDGLFINLEVVRQGLGVTDEAYSFEEQPDFLYYQGKAKKAGKGIWRKGGLNGPQRSEGPRPRGRSR
jgi:endonuclease YncB( thermonuclease family)